MRWFFPTIFFENESALGKSEFCGNDECSITIWPSMIHGMMMFFLGFRSRNDVQLFLLERFSQHEGTISLWCFLSHHHWLYDLDYFFWKRYSHQSGTVLLRNFLSSPSVVRWSFFMIERQFFFPAGGCSRKAKFRGNDDNHRHRSCNGPSYDDVRQFCGYTIATEAQPL